MAVPASAKLDRFEARFDEQDAARKRVESDRSEAEAGVKAIDRQDEAEAARGGDAAPPTEEALARLRSDRGASWLAIRHAWSTAEPATSARSIALAAGFEARVRDADDHADRLRREADRVAERAQRDLRRVELAHRVADLVAEADRLGTDREALGREWANAWEPAGLDPLPPREMKEWVTSKRGDLVRQAKELRKLRGEVAKKFAKLVAARDEIGRALEALGHPAAEPGETLSALIDRARKAVARVDEASKLAEARGEHAAAEADRAAWLGQWAEAVAPLGLGDDATPKRAMEFARQVNDLADRLDALGEHRDKLAEADRLRDRFASDVAALVDRLAPELAATAPDEAARALDDRLERARATEDRRGDRIKSLETQEKTRDKALEEVARSDDALKSLVREARVSSPDNLPEAERASDDARERRKLLATLDDQLIDQAGPIGVDRLRALAEAEASSPVPIDDRLAALAEQVAALEARRDVMAREVGQAFERLRQIDGGPKAADAQQEAEGKAALLSDDIARFVRLRLASAALNAAIERHREKNQKPVLDRAEALFAGLTLGSFPRLSVEVDDKGAAILRGVRADGSSVGVDGMSEGTADQLYLSLRLASLQAHIDHHEPMPLILDDLLVNFDNARSAAALAALADLSKRTQVLFFTHHDHLVELAQATVPADVLFVHRLDSSISVPREAPALPARGGRRKKAAPATLLEETS